MNRRNFCLSSLATAFSGAALGAGCMPGQSAAVPGAASRDNLRLSRDSLGLYKFVYDRRYPSAQAFGAAAALAPSAAGIAAITGDITELWLRDLEPVWRAAGGVIAGMTTSRSLLCLEQLAKDHWMRVAVRVEHVMVGGLIAHRLTVAESMLSRMHRALATEEWAAKLPAAFATCGLADDALVSRVIDSTCRSAGTGETLVSFVIA